MHIILDIVISVSGSTPPLQSSRLSLPVKVEYDNSPYKAILQKEYETFGLSFGFMNQYFDCTGSVECILHILVFKLGDFSSSLKFNDRFTQTETIQAYMKK